MELRHISMDGGLRAQADLIVTDGQRHKIVFVSLLGTESNLKQIEKQMNRKNGVYVRNFGNYATGFKEYDVIHGDTSFSDYRHMTLSIKDDVITSEDTGLVSMISYIYTEYSRSGFNFDEARTNPLYALPEDFTNKIYDKLYSHMPTPMIKDWKVYIARKLLAEGHIEEMRVLKDDENFRVFRMTVNSNQLARYVLTGLREGFTDINGTNRKSARMAAVEGMNSYLTEFSVPAADKLHENFKAKFVPNESVYNEKLLTLIDYASYKSGISLYEPQKIVVQATSNNLDKNDVSIIIATPGSGKTILGAASVYTNAKKSNTVSIVVSPGHLVEKWANEILRVVPLSEAMIIEDFSDFKKAEKRINDKKRRKHLFLIMSKDKAKSTYEKRPAVNWSESKGAYCCPECGQKLRKKVYVGSGKRRYEQWVDLTERDFTKEYAHNVRCNNQVRKWNTAERRWEEVDCDAPLWTPFIKEEGGGKWIRLGKSQGWIQKRHMQSLFDELASQRDIDRNDAKFIDALSEAIETEEEGSTIVRAPRKFSLANYIRRYYRHKIDYLIADELHKYKGGDSMQGQAFGDLVCAAKKVICLTGTLLNGYADSLFYILYRTFPHVMKAEGFDYGDDKEFARTFGVVRRENSFNLSEGGAVTTRIGSPNEKFLPGVSPLVFTKFLLENAVFLNLEDISSELPNYQEIPIGVQMDAETRENYDRIQSEFRSNIGWSGARNGSGTNKIVGHMVQTLSAYPDQPYDQPDILHPDTGQVVIQIPESSRTNDPRPKEEELLRICKERVDAGEKVLVYYHWTNRTDVTERLPRLMQEEGLRTTVLESNSASMRDREGWIAERTPDTDVLFCNPALVETGLDLLEYTSIIFYQVGYDIFIMRQASRRSYRLNQTKDVRVYFLYYEDTVQEQALSLMATKLQASQAIEGNFSEEGLHAMSNNEDLLTQIANSVVQGIKHTVDIDVFAGTKTREELSAPDTTFEDGLDVIFDETDTTRLNEETEAEEVITILRVEPSQPYSLHKPVQPKKKKSRKKPVIDATMLNNQEFLRRLRSKEMHIIDVV